MLKFFLLAVNEQIKMWGKLSTKVLLASVLVAALGYTFIMYTEGNRRNSHGNMVFQTQLTAQDLLARFEDEDARFIGWERVAARYQYFIDHDIETIPVVIVHGNPWQRRVEQHPQAWRTEAIYTMFEARWATEAYAEGAGACELAVWGCECPLCLLAHMDEAIRADDWAGFAQAHLAWFAQRFWHGMASSHLETAQRAADAFAEDAPHLWYLQQIVAHNAYRGSWQYEVIAEVREAKTALARLGGDMPNLRDVVLMGEYRLAHGIEHYTFRGMEQLFLWPPETLPPFWRGFAPGVNVVTFLGVVLIVLAGGLVAGEYSAGTIKFLLINPVSRRKILLAKYAALLETAVMLLAVLFVANFIASGVFFGFEGAFAPLLRVADGAVVRESAFLFMASRYVLGAVGMVVLVTFAFMLSALVRSVALAIGLASFLYFGGWTAVSVLQMMGFYQARYILFANTNIVNVAAGATGFVGHTVGFALANIAVYMVVFLWTAWDAFTRTDVK